MGNFESFIGVNFWTALFVLINTLTIFFVAKKFLIGPVLAMIQARQQEIDDMYAQAGGTQQQAEKMRAEYQKKLADAQTASERMVAEAMSRAQRREEEIIRQANQEASAILDKAAADIEQEKKKAINDAKDEISDMAMAIAGKVVGRALTADDQSALVDSFINELGE